MDIKVLLFILLAGLVDGGVIEGYEDPDEIYNMGREPKGSPSSVEDFKEYDPRENGTEKENAQRTNATVVESATVLENAQKKSTGSRPNATVLEGETLVENTLGNSIALEGKKENSTVLEGKKENSIALEGNKYNSTVLEGNKENSTVLEGKKENSNVLEGKKENSISLEGNKENSTVLHGTNRMRIPSSDEKTTNNVSAFEAEIHDILNGTTRLVTPTSDQKTDKDIIALGDDVVEDQAMDDATLENATRNVEKIHNSTSSGNNTYVKPIFVLDDFLNGISSLSGRILKGNNSVSAEHLRRDEATTMVYLYSTGESLTANELGNNGTMDAGNKTMNPGNMTSWNKSIGHQNTSDGRNNGDTGIIGERNSGGWPQRSNVTLSDLADAQTAKKIWMYGSPILIAGGTLGNVLSFAVMLRKKIRHTTTSLYLLVLSVVDTVVLYTGLLRLYMKNTSGFDIRHSSGLACKFHLFSVYAIQQFASWILVSVTLERLCAVFLPYKSKEIFTKQFATLSLVIQALVIIIINSNFFYTHELLQYRSVDGSIGAICFTPLETHLSFISNIWPWIDFCLFSLLPFAVIITSNIAIVCRLLWSRYVRRRHLRATHDVKMSSMTAILITVSVVFFLTTAPISIFLILSAMLHQDADLQKRAYMALIWAVLNMILYTNNAVNFLLYCLSGPRFRRELRVMFCRINSIHPANTTTVIELQNG